MRGRGRLLILIGLIVLLGAIAAVILITQQQRTGSGGTAEATREVPGAIVEPSATPVPVVEIVVALQNLPRGLRLPDNIEDLPEDSRPVAIRRWPLDVDGDGIGDIPVNAINNIADVEGKILRTDVGREVPLLSTMLVDDLSRIAAEGSDAAAVMPGGMVAISIPMDRLTGVAYAIRAGDYVDIILSFLYVDIDPEFQSLTPNKITLVSTDDQGNIQLEQAIEGRLDVGLGGQPVVVGPSEPQRPRLLTQRTVQAAWVLRVGDFPLTGGYIGSTPTPRPSPTPEGGEQQQAAGRPVAAPTAVPPPDIITLAVTPQDAVTLVWAIEARIPITLALRSVQDISQGETQPVTLEYIMGRYNISVPTGLPYSLEPALRSIRQLAVFNEISLNAGNSGN